MRRVVALEDEVRRLRAELKEAYRDQNTADIIWEIVGTIASAPRNPPDWLGGQGSQARCNGKICRCIHRAREDWPQRTRSVPAPAAPMTGAGPPHRPTASAPRPPPPL